VSVATVRPRLHPGRQLPRVKPFVAGPTARIVAAPAGGARSGRHVRRSLRELVFSHGVPRLTTRTSPVRNASATTPVGWLRTVTAPAVGVSHTSAPTAP
jgi:hypothetical protein